MARFRALVCFDALLLTTATLLTPATAAPPRSAPLPLAFVADIPLPGGATRFDYQWLDAAKRRLYIAHLGDSSLLVFDLDAQRVLREIPQLPSVHGVIAAPDRRLVLATATAEKTLVLLDDQTFDVKARVPAGQYPNGLAYDPSSGKAFVSNNSGPGVAVIDLDSQRALPSVELGGGAGNTQYDAGTGHVLAAVHGLPSLSEIDPSTSKVVGRIALHGVSTCHGLLVSAPERLAFAACRGHSPRLVMVDLRARKQLLDLPLPADIDVLAFDVGLQRLYAASETGTVVVFALGPDHALGEVGRGFLAPNAHTVAVDSTTHRVYFPLPNAGGHPVLRVMEPRAAN
jgi:DNA-binding beta-propeller fold protein YncE